jgi:hypothetical protein
VYDKEECQLVGFMDLDDTNNHLQAFEKTLTDSTSKPTLATHMIEGIVFQPPVPLCTVSMLFT